MANFDGTDDYFDSRDVIARIEELTAEWEEATESTASDYSLTEDDWALGLGEEGAAEMVALRALQEEVEVYVSGWLYGTFISDGYFEEYAEEMAYNIGAIDREAAWPLNRIDWKAAAEDLKIDYTSFEFRGTTYWAR